MNQNPVKTIGINDEPRKDSHLVYVNQADGLKGILNRDFDEWSNFDSWESISVQQWIFSIALEVFRGKKIDIKCDCCENEFIREAAIVPSHRASNDFHHVCSDCDAQTFAQKIGVKLRRIYKIDASSTKVKL